MIKLEKTLPGGILYYYLMYLVKKLGQYSAVFPELTGEDTVREYSAVLLDITGDRYVQTVFCTITSFYWERHCQTVFFIIT